MMVTWMAKRMSIPGMTMLMIVVIGCDAQPRETAVINEDPMAAVPTARGEIPQMSATKGEPPMPDLTRMHFDLSRRSLDLYELPDRSARWMLASPMSPKGVPIGLNYQFPMEVEFDLSQVAVFYVVKNHRPSSAVSLEQIVEMQTTPVSRQ
jgi:hypothetical protein